jgi:hypothetical protein
MYLHIHPVCQPVSCNPYSNAFPLHLLKPLWTKKLNVCRSQVMVNLLWKGRGQQSRHDLF